jgi:hypothetical protein
MEIKELLQNLQHGLMIWRVLMEVLQDIWGARAREVYCRGEELRR